MRRILLTYLALFSFIALKLPVYSQNWEQTAKTLPKKYLTNYYDFYGYAVDIDGDYAVVGAHNDSEYAAWNGGAYVLHKTSSGWETIAKLSPSNDSKFVDFGYSVAISGDQIVIGARGEDIPYFRSGAAYVYVKPSGGWTDMTENAILKLSESLSSEILGESVAIEDDIIVVGALTGQIDYVRMGTAYIYEKPEGGWTNMTESATLHASDGQQHDFFGKSVAISGDVIVVGANKDFIDDEQIGSAYIFSKPEGGWTDMTETAKITPSDGVANDLFGNSIDIENDIITVGAPATTYDGTASGSIYVFEKPSAGWEDMNQTAKLTASNSDDIYNFGLSVAISDNQIVTGSYMDVYEINQNSAYVFVKPESGWSDMTETTILQSSDGDDSDYFGTAVSISGDHVIIGASLDDDMHYSSGSAYVFEKPETGWSSVDETSKILPIPYLANTDNRFGYNVAIDGNYAVVGAYADSEIDYQIGAAYVLHKTSEGWQNIAKLTPSNGGHTDWFAVSIAISGDVIVIGSSVNDSHGTRSGTAYVYQKPIDGWVDMNETAQLSHSNIEAEDRFGHTVAIHGDFIAVGTPSNNEDHKGIYVFKKPSEGWNDNVNEIAFLTLSNPENVNSSYHSLAMSENDIVVGYVGDNVNGSNSGAAYVYTKPEEGWTNMTETAKLYPSDGLSSDYFGNSIDIHNDQIVVSALEAHHNNIRSGSAYVFVKPDGGWTEMNQTAKLVPSDGEHSDFFGQSVGIYNDQIVIGSKYNEEVGSQSGSVYYYKKPEEGWSDMTENAKINANDPESGDAFGSGVDISGYNIIIGAEGVKDHGSSAGAAYIFTDTEDYAPNFTKGPDQQILEDAGTQTISGWATNITSGSAGNDQNLEFFIENDNNNLFTVQPSINATTGDLNYTPAVDAYGVATLNVTLKDNTDEDTSEIKTFTITITPVNDAPSFSIGENQQVLEDAPAQTVDNFLAEIIMGPDNESDQTILSYNVSNDNSSLFTVAPFIDNEGKLQYTLQQDANGVALVAVSISDNGGTDNGGVDISEEQTFTITVTPVNDVPSFVVGENQIVLEDALAQKVNNFLNSINLGPDNENSQSILSYNLSNDNNNLFSTPPFIDSEGSLQYTLQQDANGIANVTVSIRDNGGTDNGGIDTSEEQTFIITVTPVNDAPSFAISENQDVLEDSPTQIISNFLTSISLGPDDENNQSILSYHLSNDNNGLFTQQPYIDSEGSLQYTLQPDANGVANVAVSITDDGGTENGGIDTSEEQTFIITVTPVNDAPSMSIGENINVFEDAGVITVSEWASNIYKGAENESDQILSLGISNDNHNLFETQPDINLENGNLTFTTAPNSHGEATITLVIFDDGGTQYGGLDFSEDYIFTITINAVNDAPEISILGDQTILEDAGQQTVSNFVNLLHFGADNENGQSILNYQISNNSNYLFSEQPSIDSEGNLSFAPAENIFGEATVEVSLTDDGGTENGGNNTSVNHTFNIIITPVNDSPEITNTPDLTATEDIEYVHAFSISDPDDNNNGSELNWSLSNQPSGMEISNTGVISWTPLNDVLSSGDVTVTVSDGGEDGASSSSQTFNINVTPVNDTPLVGNVENISLCLGNTEVIDLNEIISDEESLIGDLTYSYNISESIPGLDIVFDTDAHLMIIINNTNQATSQVTVELTAEDPDGALGTNSFDIKLEYLDIIISQDGNILTATEGNTYQWFRDGIVISEVDGGTAQVFVASEVGKYKVAVAYGADCIGVSEELEIDHLTSLESDQFTNELIIYPNPTAQKINISSKNVPLTDLLIEVIDTQGNIIIKKNSIKTIDLSDYPRGVYMVRFIKEGRYVTTKRIVKY